MTSQYGKFIMKIKLTRADYVGWQSQIAMNIKIAMMKVKEGNNAMAWIEDLLKRMPKPKKK